MSEIPASQLSQAEPRGNTKTLGNTNQLYLWLITLPADEETASQLSQQLKEFCKKFTFQKEKGKETGFLHWQIFISLKVKEKFNTVKNLFPSKAHIEPVKNGWKAAQYCSKEDTRVEGPYTEESEFIEIIEKLRPWQKDLENELMGKADDRTLIWYYDEDGGAGKTKFCKYMAIKHKADILMNGGSKDIAFAMSDNPKIVIINFTRTNEDRINYGILEQIKDGMVFSSKYESKIKIFNSPHVVCFANFEPDTTTMSKDRWDIRSISKHTGITQALANRSLCGANAPI